MIDKKIINELKEAFDLISNKVADSNDEIEYWYARDLQKLLGYARWENFELAINRAKESCRSQNIECSDHFRDVTKMIEIGKGGKREVLDIMLTRYASYLIAQNGDPRKTEVAFAQSYFAVQTRRAEIIEERLNSLSRLDSRARLKESEKRLSKNIYERGVDDKGFARIRAKGDCALFGGYNTESMKSKLNIRQKNRPLADFLPNLTIAAKNLATEMTNHNVEDKDLIGENSITTEHVQNNKTIRKMLGERGIKPEELPVAEDIKKLERRVAKEEKNITKNIKKLP